jgi:Excreted virulence factor EspC, type VII ESX diderm
MPRIEVDPGQLHSAGGRQAALADQVAGLRGALEAAGASASGAAGDGAAAAAIADCAGAWSVSLGALAQSVGGLATNLGAAGSAYAQTDATAIQGPR